MTPSWTSYPFERPRAVLAVAGLVALAACEAPPTELELEASFSRAAPTITFEDLGDLAGGPERANLFAINDPGQMAGRSNGPDGSVAVVIDKKGGFTPVTSLNSRAEGINNRGWVVGLFAGAGGLHAFLHDGNDFIDIGPGTATAVNDRGMVVGQSWATSPVSAYAYEDGVMTQLMTELSGAAAVNARGQVVGSYVNGDGAQIPFLWERGTRTDLPTDGGAITATSINDAGTVVGYGLDADGEWVVTLWRDGELSYLPSSAPTEVRGINNRGEVVGNVRDVPSPFQAVVWIDGEMVELPNPYGGLSRAWAINDRGQIAGWVRTPTGDHAARWTLR